MGGEKKRSSSSSKETLEKSQQNLAEKGLVLINDDDDDDTSSHVILNPYYNCQQPLFGYATSVEDILDKNKIMEGVFGEEAKTDMDGDKSFSSSLLNGKPQIKISLKVLDELRDKWKNSLIVTLFGKTIKYDILCSKACVLWNLQGGFKALDLGENYFLFTFQSIEDRMHVYTEGPWVVMDHFLSVRKWEPNFKPSEARKDLKTAVWVCFHELPVEFLNDKILYNVAKSIGRPIKVDHNAQGKFARVCIEVDLDKPLCPVIEIDGKDCVVEYESLHFFCFECSRFGHIKDINCDGAMILKKEAPETNNYEGDSKLVKEDNMNKEKSKENMKENGSSSVMMQDGGYQSDESDDGSYPAPDFNDFEKDRTKDCFQEGQVWAVYDTLDFMPRVYAQINNIISKSDSKVSIRWLKLDSDDENELKWVNAGMPVACGNFRKGKTDITDNHRMYSYRVDLEKGSKIDTYKIYPRKGEIWALFKTWDMNWHSDPEPKTKYELEFAEILSDYSDDTGVTIIYLGKVKGFSCVFTRISDGGLHMFQIPPSNLLKFSHRVPYYHLSGEEREDVPKNSFELDPAALPSELEEIDNPKDIKAELEEVVIFKEDSHVCEMEEEIKLDSSYDHSEDDTVPDTEFNDFCWRSEEEFLIGEIWALYNNLDGMPNCYGIIKRIDYEPEFKLHVTWLIPCPANNALQFNDKHIRVGCGIFRRSKGGTRAEIDAFSHRLNVGISDKMRVFSIFPRKHEVWAVYKNWNSEMTVSDLENCEYDIVEVLEVNEFATIGLVLERVSGYNFVFKARKDNGTCVAIEILRSEQIKFSHQIPAFRLTKEKGGSLRGYWELDPDGLPDIFFD